MQGIQTFFTELFQYVKTTVENFQIWDILDIACLAIIVYFVIRFIRDSRAAQLVKGIVVIFVLLGLSSIFHLDASNYLLNSAVEYGILALLIVFQPELRSMLENFGRRSFSKIKMTSKENEEAQKETVNMIRAITTEVANLSATKTGALIVMERETKLGEIIETGTVVNADISPEMLGNIFFNKAPLHDGAMVIRNKRIHAAGCFLPLTQQELNTELGTRHRAGLGVSEVSDALVIIVSEESGIISVAEQGKLKRRITPDALTGILKTAFMPEKEEKKDILSSLWKGKKQDKNDK